MDTIKKWEQRAWNPITGCTKISDACNNCYAEKVSIRHYLAGHRMYQNGFKPTIHLENINQPLFWSVPQIIFVCSSSDLFHESISDDFILKIFEVMNSANWHIFQILTKRTERLAKLSPKINWSKNIYLEKNIFYKFRLL